MARGEHDSDLGQRRKKGWCGTKVVWWSRAELALPSLDLSRRGRRWGILEGGDTRGAAAVVNGKGDQGALRHTDGEGWRFEFCVREELAVAAFYRSMRRSRRDARGAVSCGVMTRSALYLFVMPYCRWGCIYGEEWMVTGLSCRGAKAEPCAMS